jgi:hypothetical protein
LFEAASVAAYGTRCPAGGLKKSLKICDMVIYISEQAAFYLGMDRFLLTALLMKSDEYHPRYARWTLHGRH